MCDAEARRGMPLPAANLIWPIPFSAFVSAFSLVRLRPVVQTMTYDCRFKCQNGHCCRGPKRKLLVPLRNLVSPFSL